MRGKTRRFLCKTSRAVSNLVSLRSLHLWWGFAGPFLAPLPSRLPRLSLALPVLDIGNVRPVGCRCCSFSRPFPASATLAGGPSGRCPPSVLHTLRKTGEKYCTLLPKSSVQTFADACQKAFRPSKILTRHRVPFRADFGPNFIVLPSCVVNCVG